MYPKNAASPEPIAIGAVVQISDGAVQTSGCTVRVKPIGVAEADGGGTTAYTTDGIVLYTPLQTETNYTSFVLIAKKTGCIPVAITVVTSASATAGYAGTDQGKIANPTSTVNLSGTTIKTATDVETDTADIQSRLPAALVTGRIDARVGEMAANTLTASALAIDAVTEIQSGLATPTNITAGTITTVTNLTNLPAITTNWLTAAGLAADAVAEIQSGLATSANQATIIGYLDTEIAAILADTNELQTDLVNGGRLDLLIDAIKAKTDNLPASPAATGDIPTAIQIRTEIDSNSTKLTSIVADTNELQTDWTNGGRLDLLLDAILADTGTDGVVLSSTTMNNIAAALLDLSNGVETGVTLRQTLRAVLSASAGKLSGAATTTVSIRDVGDTKNRISATVDADGNRSAVTLDLT